jgi:hypothetical protein
VKKLKFREQQMDEVVRVELGPGKAPTPQRKPGTVDEILATHVLQYLTAQERMTFANAAHKALKVGGKLVVVVPIWSCQRAYQDLAVQWPPVAEGWFQYLNKSWREAQPVKISGYTCDFDFTLGYGMHPAITPRNPDYQQTAIQFWKEAAQDIHVTMTKR